MNKIDVMSSQVALGAFADTWHEIEAGGETTPKLAFGRRRELFSAITEKRLELLRQVASHKEFNVRQLARSLDRAYTNVHTDVPDLVELGLLDRADDGALLASYHEILIHVGIRDAARGHRPSMGWATAGER
jgi:predicted transcriptional regulator